MKITRFDVTLNQDDTVSVNISYQNGDLLAATLNAQTLADLIAENEGLLSVTPEDHYDESMDGDHESALASCGWGTDEDYGYYGE